MKKPSALLPIAFLCSLNALAAGTPNPYLSAPVYGLTHFDSSQSDTHPYPVKPGVFRADLAKQPRVPGGPVNTMSMSAAQPGFFWSIATDRISYVDARKGGWTIATQMALPGVRKLKDEDLDRLFSPRYESEAQVEALAKSVLGPSPAAVMHNGVYTVADRDNTVYVGTGNQIQAIGLKDPANPSAGLEVKRTLDATKIFPPHEVFPGTGAAVRLIGMGMTYDGHLIVGSTNSIAVVDRLFTQPASLYAFPAGQLVTNSFAVDADNSIYVASGALQPGKDGLMHRLVWTGSKLSGDEADGAWVSPYDGGRWPPAIKTGTGTGSTPTLMGFGKDKDRLVVITDGRDRMNIVAFWRDQIPAGFQQKAGTKSRRIADQMPITAGLPLSTPWIQSEQSVVVNGWGAFVVNNIVPKGHPDKIVDVLLNGPVVQGPSGMQRVEWDPVAHRWDLVWTRNDVVSNSMVPVASSAASMVFVNGYTAKDGWEVTGLDWKSGKVVYRTIFGHGNLGNGAYALLQHFPNGDLLFNSVGGPFRIHTK